MRSSVEMRLKKTVRSQSGSSLARTGCSQRPIAEKSAGGSGVSGSLGLDVHHEGVDHLEDSPANDVPDPGLAC